MQRGNGIPDEDAPNDPESVRFWCWVGGRYTDREKTSLSMEASANVRPTADSLGSMLASSNGVMGTSQLMISNGGAPTPNVPTSGPSLEALKNVMNQSVAAAKPKVKSGPKVKAKAKAAAIQTPKTPAEHKDALRALNLLSNFHSPYFTKFGVWITTPKSRHVS